MLKQKILGVIPARYNSSRLPGKPLFLINRKPLIQKVFENAKRSESLDRILVATDDRRILDTVEKFGGEAVLTSKNNRTGTDRVFEASKNLKYDIILNIQCDEASFNPRMIDDLISQMRKNKRILMGTLARKIKDEKSLKNPDVVKVVLDKDGNALYFSRYPIPFLRPDGFKPKRNLFYEHIGIYAFRKNFLKKFSDLPQTPLEKSERLEQLRALESGYKIKVFLTEHNSKALNSYQDLKRLNRKGV
ncbi:MAG: 3-deoxy-manno-octulosonate cytidylyltransferase [Bacteroides sp. SM23_62]|nr:MAG: 3-deoxy-manno-octulosonate cytidylyltransferase [Bacteroides sp. SM23_62]